MKRLLADIRALRRAYDVDHTVAGDVLDTVVAAICTAGLIGHVLLGFTLWENTHG